MFKILNIPLFMTTTHPYHCLTIWSRTQLTKKRGFLLCYSKLRIRFKSVHKLSLLGRTCRQLFVEVPFQTLQIYDRTWTYTKHLYLYTRCILNPCHKLKGGGDSLGRFRPISRKMRQPAILTFFKLYKIHHILEFKYAVL